MEQSSQSCFFFATFQQVNLNANFNLEAIMEMYAEAISSMAVFQEQQRSFVCINRISAQNDTIYNPRIVIFV